MNRIPAPPQTQALFSDSFRPPPLDGSLTLAQIWDWHAENTPEHRLFVYANSDGSIRTILWPEAVRAVHTGANMLGSRVTHSFSAKPVVAIVAMSDSITYLTMMMSIMRTNFIAFPISPRNSPGAVAHLFNKVNVSHVLVGRDPSMRDLAKAALEVLKRDYPTATPPELSSMPIFEDLFLPENEAAQIKAKDIPMTSKPDDITIYLHSSGSTAYPKPIAWTNRRFIEVAIIPYFGELDLCDKLFSLHVMPMYHGLGIGQLAWTASCGLVVAVFQPKAPAMLPTLDNLFQAAKLTKSDFIFCVPSFIEAWSQQPEYVAWLATRIGVLYSGGPLNKQVGDFLTTKKVTIFTVYGSSEGGIMSPMLLKHIGHDWDFFQFTDLFTAYMIPHGNNTFELAMVTSKFWTASIVNMKVDGIDAYATSDLFIPHATKPGFWRIFGRADDQIMHNTGEKTNPGPLESILNQDPHVSASVMFGRGHFQAGVLVDPKPAFRFDPANESDLAEFRNKIWPTVEKMNRYAPQHSRLFKELLVPEPLQMILVAKPSKPFTYTAKNTARRQAILNDYQDDIEQAYITVDETTQINIESPNEWDPVSTRSFVRAVVWKILSHEAEDAEDLFQHGCDSLQATWIRNSLLRALRDSAHIDTRVLTDNFVYEHPSIRQLSVYLWTLASNGGIPVDVSASNQIQLMQEMVDKYTQDLVPASSTTTEKRLEPVVLVTGTTGALGSYLLAALCSNLAVKKIYALNRTGSNSQRRQKSSFVERGLDLDALNDSRVVFLEGDTAVGGFGIDATIHAEMLNSVTHIIHNAWRVDFNLGLPSFDLNIRGVRVVVDFVLSSQALLVYTSSIGVLQNAKDDIFPIPETHSDPVMSLGTGYAQSKWVSEEILRTAAEQAGLDYLVICVGQLCGDKNTGVWNMKEWVPALIQAAMDPQIACLPDDPRLISWIQIDIAAKAMVEMMTSNPPDSRVIHLIHPRPGSWSSISGAVKAPLILYDKWIQKLDNHKGEKLTAVRLLPFYRGVASANGSEAFGFPALGTKNACASSRVLSAEDLPQLDQELVLKWMSYWSPAGLFTK
ncbi:hypothetical protein C8J56DRAFT_1006701 [Mycena floridula]|nr:hypothetical protein C8J56DRAFT_1006701 [Mycena floridula]